ncbi:MAG: hypothetical protein IH840_01020 [Candidatus Heimdallarchaeota archaeon]|nr:hypothetical protein [Candidatus Heimdallarchaeota archaeon]
MPKVKFLSYIRRTSGVESFILDEPVNSVREALNVIADKYPQLRELILDDVPEVSFILGGKNLLIPRDLDLPFTETLTIGPIVAGG